MERTPSAPGIVPEPLDSIESTFMMSPEKPSVVLCDFEADFDSSFGGVSLSGHALPTVEMGRGFEDAYYLN